MDQPLIALFISAKRHGSSPAPSRSASNDKCKKENGSSFLTVVGRNRRMEVGQSLSALPRVSQTSTCSTIREPFRGVAEHSSVMSMVFVSSYFRKRGAWLAFHEKREPDLESRSDIRENGTTDGFADSADTRRD
jgi:hypothetical protein